MYAKPGDRLVIKSHRVGEHDRLAKILKVRGDRGQPPYIVEWLDDGHEGMIYPGNDAVIEHKRRKTA